jgi:hypothetical protein
MGRPVNGGMVGIYLVFLGVFDRWHVTRNGDFTPQRWFWYQQTYRFHVFLNDYGEVYQQEAEIERPSANKKQSSPWRRGFSTTNHGETDPLKVKPPIRRIVFWRFLSGLPITCLSRISRAIFRHLRITDCGLPRIADYLLWGKTQLSAVYPLLSTQY